jgi:hypothetical protein
MSPHTTSCHKFSKIPPVSATSTEISHATSANKTSVATHAVRTVWLWIWPPTDLKPLSADSKGVCVPNRFHDDLRAEAAIFAILENDNKAECEEARQHHGPPSPGSHPVAGKNIYFDRKPIVRGTFTQGLSSLKRRTSMVLRSIFGQKCYY